MNAPFLPYQHDEEFESAGLLTGFLAADPDARAEFPARLIPQRNHLPPPLRPRAAATAASSSAAGTRAVPPDAWGNTMPRNRPSI